jgi:hypothetical protein
MRNANEVYHSRTELQRTVFNTAYLNINQANTNIFNPLKPNGKYMYHLL